MKYTLIFLVLFLLLVVQGGFIDRLLFVKAGNLVLLFVTVSVILGSYKDSLYSAVAGGLMIDLASATRVGTATIAMVVVFGVTYIVINKFVTREPNRLLLFAVVALDTIIFSVAVVLVNKFFVFAGLDTPIDWRFILGKKLLLDLIANTLFIYPVYIVYLWVEKLERRLQKYV